MSVNRNKFNNNVNFAFLTKYYEEARTRMVKICNYVYRDHGTSVLKFFSTMEQDIIRNKSWDPETRDSVITTESMAGNIL